MHGPTPAARRPIATTGGAEVTNGSGGPPPLDPPPDLPTEPSVTGSSGTATLEQLVRTEGRVVLASLVRATGSLDIAEEAVQDATVRALERWRTHGVPPNPRAWLITTARNRAIDIIRRERARETKEIEATEMARIERTDLDPGTGDDLLRLVFTCCHPSLSVDAQVALSLRTLCGLTTSEIARALLVPEATMTKRLTRARTKIRVAGIPYRVPDAHELPDRLGAVATTLYLLFNEGYAATAGDAVVRDALCEQAIQVTGNLVALMPDEVSLRGLLALMVLHHARSSARTSPTGDVVLLADQDRTRWDHDAIRRGVVLVGDALRRSPDVPDRFVVEAAIAGCHDLAATSADTDWGAIVSWYDVLLAAGAGSVARLNRAVALAELEGPGPALAELDAIEDLASYPYWAAARADLLARLGRTDEARAAYDVALAHALPDPQRALLTARQARLAPCP